MVVPSNYLFSTQLHLLLFCCWGCGCCWAVTILIVFLVIFDTILSKHINRMKKQLGMFAIVKFPNAICYFPPEKMEHATLKVNASQGMVK